jgi:hypothetical protein
MADERNPTDENEEMGRTNEEDITAIADEEDFEDIDEVEEDAEEEDDLES